MLAGIQSTLNRPAQATNRTAMGKTNLCFGSAAPVIGRNAIKIPTATTTMLANDRQTFRRVLGIHHADEASNAANQKIELFFRTSITFLIS